MKIHFEPLAKRHSRKDFACGDPSLDHWFKTQASQDERRNVARVFVALDEKGVVGFYSLSMFTLTIDDLPPELSRELPNYRAIPAALIGRLARHERVRGCGIGELLVADAIARILAITATVAAYAIVVEAINGRAAAFYRAFGFIPFPSHPHRLFLLTQTALRAVSK